MQVVPCRSDGLEFELQAYAVRIRYTSIDGLQVLRVVRHRGRPQLFPVGTAHKLGQLVSHIGDAHLIVHMQLRCDPQYAFDQSSGKMRCEQAVIKQVEAQYAPDMKLGEQ